LNKQQGWIKNVSEAFSASSPAIARQAVRLASVIIATLFLFHPIQRFDNAAFNRVFKKHGFDLAVELSLQ